jgi:hypothetical protein
MRITFFSCIEGKVETGLIPKSKYEALANKYEALYGAYIKNMDDISAARAAAEKVIKAEASVFMQKKINTYRSAIQSKRIFDDLELLAKEEKTSFNRQLTLLLNRAEGRGRAVTKDLGKILNDFIEQNRAKYAGLVVNRVDIPDTIRELRGTKTKNKAAKAYAEALRESQNYLINRYRKAGGIIGQIEDYTFQTHNPKAMRKAKFEGWFADLNRLKLDRERMVNEATGLPFTDEEWGAVAKFIYDDAISSGGAAAQARLEKGLKTLGFKGGFESRKSSARLIHFKTADGFLEYNRIYGSGDEYLYDSIMSGMQSLARDIGILETLSAKPDSLMRNAELRMKAKGEFAPLMQARYRVLTGYTDQKWSEGGFWDGLNTLNNNITQLRVSSLLGKAVVSALGDSTFVALTAKANGMPAVQALKKWGSLINPLDSKDRQLANNMGYIIEVANSTAISQAKLASDVRGGKIPQFLANLTIEGSGLGAVTRGGQNAMSLQAMSTLAVYRDIPWNELDPKFRKALNHYGIRVDSWDKLKDIELYSPREGVSLLDPDSIPDEALRNNIYDWIEDMRSVAINRPSLTTRALSTGGGLKRGHPIRFFAASAFFLKSFPVTVMDNFLFPAFRNAEFAKAAQSLKAGQVGQAASEANLAEIATTIMTLGVWTTIMGAGLNQAYALVDGKTAKDMDSVDFWKEAAMRGGGLGLLGDFLFRDYDMYGNDQLDKTIGRFVGGAWYDPLVQTAGVLAAPFDEDKDTGEKLFKLIKSNFPAKSIWYIKTPLERMFLDQIEMIANPDYAKQWKRAEKYMKEDGQEYWWDRGEVLP